MLNFSQRPLLMGVASSTGAGRGAPSRSSERTESRFSNHSYIHLTTNCHLTGKRSRYWVVFLVNAPPMMLWFLSHTKQLPPKMLEIWRNLTDSWYPNLKHYFACHQVLLPDTKPPNTTKPTEKQLHLKKSWLQAVQQTCHKCCTSWKHNGNLTPSCAPKLSQILRKLKTTCKSDSRLSTKVVTSAPNMQSPMEPSSRTWAEPTRTRSFQKCS